MFKEINGKNSIQRKKATATAITLVLILGLSAFISLPVVGAPTVITLDGPYFVPFIGLNSPTLITWTPNPNVLMTDPALMGKASIWPTGTLTYTRPDGTKDIVKGPFDVKVTSVQGENSEIQVPYTPNMMGTWTVNLYWPGDATYAPVNKTGTFPVGQHYDKRDTWAMLSFKPYPAIGLGQTLLINAWVTPPPVTNHMVFHDVLFTITKPDGSSFKVGPMDTEAPGTVWFDYPINQLGNWTIKFDFPGDYISKPSSVTRSVMCQQNPVPLGNPDTPLPTEEWTFPINTINREWRNIAGPWFQNDYNASLGDTNIYTEAPKTAHISWKLTANQGIGGFIGMPHSIQTGSGEEVYGAGDVGLYSTSSININTVMAGRGYYTYSGSIYCVDMRTGEQLWSVPGSFNVGATRSAQPVLYSFGSRFIVYNAITGAMTLNVTGLSMAFFVDPYVYSVSGNYLIGWSVEGTSTTFASRILWNVTNVLPNTSSSHSLIQNNLWIARHFQTGTPGNTIIVDYLTAINLATGAMQYNISTMDPANINSWIYRQGPAIGAGFGKVFFADIGWENQGKGYIAYDAATGREAWHSEPADYPWGNFWAYTPQACGYNLVFALGYSGVYAYNVTNGKIVWHYIPVDTYNEQPYASNIAPNGSSYASSAFGSTGSLAGGGILFAPNTEHSPTFYYRNQKLHAINVTTGQKVWTISGIYNPSSIAYGVLVAPETPSGITYAFSKGPTQTTLSTSSKVLARGSPVLLEGTVTDQSSAQKGTPAIADESMTPWMEYIHMQQPKPTNAKGVKVHLTAIDPNGNYQDIGIVTSTINGNFNAMWTPPVEGAYTITAAFEGSEAYYASSAETSMGVGPAASPAAIVSPSPSATPASSPAPTQIVSPSPSAIVPPPTSPNTATTYIAIAVAVVIIVVTAAALILRKRK
jgi:outer membrane protein assembly factor BamB